MTERDRDSRAARTLTPERALAFSDGVFAIVITIIVLGIEAPSNLDVGAAEFEEIRSKALHQLWVYFVSFCIVGSYWIQHTMLFGSLRSVDRATVVRNLIYLLPVTLLPFATQVMGAHRTAWTGVALFGVVNLGAVLAHSWVWARTAPHAGTENGGQVGSPRRIVTSKLLLFSAVIVAGIVVATVDTGAGVGVFLLLPAIFIYDYLRA